VVGDILAAKKLANNDTDFLFFALDLYIPPNLSKGTGTSMLHHSALEFVNFGQIKLMVKKMFV
jgi:hypothetical protein